MPTPIFPITEARLSIYPTHLSVNPSLVMGNALTTTIRLCIWLRCCPVELLWREETLKHVSDKITGAPGIPGTITSGAVKTICLESKERSCRWGTTSTHYLNTRKDHCWHWNWQLSQNQIDLGSIFLPCCNLSSHLHVCLNSQWSHANVKQLKSLPCSPFSLKPVEPHTCQTLLS